MFQAGSSSGNELRLVRDMSKDGIRSQHPGEVEDQKKGNSKDWQH